VITPRATRLVRAADLQTFRDAAAALACEGGATDARSRLVIVPTRAAGAHLIRSLEDRLTALRPVVVLPDLATRDELAERLAARLDDPPTTPTAAEREVLMASACRDARDAGAEPPFALRPGLVAEILQFYDELYRHQTDVDRFERLALGVLEPGAADDRGAERLVRQTRFLAAAFRAFEARTAGIGPDEHRLRALLTTHPARRPYLHVVLTVGDRAFAPEGLYPADWDLLARLPGLGRLDVVMTDAVLAGGQHERLHRMLPGLEEVRWESSRPAPPPLLIVPPESPAATAPRPSRDPSGAAAMKAHAVRDREEEIAVFARRVRDLVRRGDLASTDRAALVVRHPLPYVYLAREVLRSAGMACQLFDALPLAAEPYAAALDLVMTLVASGFARRPAVELLGSPHFRFASADGRLTARDVAALDRALAAAGYLGDQDMLGRLVERWQAPSDAALPSAHRAGCVLREVTRALSPLRARAPAASHLRCLRAFLDRYAAVPGPDGLLRARQLRARGAILATLDELADAFARFDPTPADVEQVWAMVRRRIEAQTFRPRAGDSGVHVVDAASAPFGEFDMAQLAGLVDGEWPEQPRRNVFYAPGVLRALGWPAETDRLDGARSAFRDLLRLPAARIVVTTFTLEADTLVAPSPLLDDVDRAGLVVMEEAVPARRVFEHEALGFDPLEVAPLPAAAREWAELRLGLPPARSAAYRGATAGHRPRAHAVSSLERYRDCPFKYFAADVLGLEEPLDDEVTLSPRARGRFVHEVFKRFYEEWAVRGGGAIPPEGADDARRLFVEVAEPLLARLPEADRLVERARLLGSAVSVGAVDIVLGVEAARPLGVRERRLEVRFEGEFTLGDPAGRRVPLVGVADRVDLVDGGRLRVLDYKTGQPPSAQRALQVPIYALCARERLQADGGAWEVEEAAYVAFKGRRWLVPVVRAGDPGSGEALASARARLFEAVDRIAAGEFPPRPHDVSLCASCAFPSICRKDYA
jgi:RecB family exonuclease